VSAGRRPADTEKRLPTPSRNSTVTGIPYQQQLSAPYGRTCGAAALAMVYASLGLPDCQKAVWSQIAGEDKDVRRTTGSFRLARHALDRGLSAAVLQAARPWDTLASCWFTGARVILNHRLRPDSPLGHFSVLAGFDDDEVFVHDPQFGPFRRLTRDRLLRLWLPSAGGSEIVGHVLVAIASRDDQPNRCDSCGAMVPAQVGCGRCGNLVPLRPVAALGCSKRDCGARLWKYVFCPCCDFPTGEVE